MNNKKNDIVFKIQELDRRRIARDLHDTSLQNLAHMVHKLELVSMYMDRDMIQAKLELALISKNINSIIDEIRNIIFDLRPMSFDDFGLKESIEDMLEKLKKDSDIAVTSCIDPIKDFDENSSIAIFRIIQECVLNAYKHSHAKHVQVVLKERKEDLYLSVEDDGVGFEQNIIRNKEKHFGIFIMKERVEIMSGKIKILSEPDKGVKIIVTIPRQQ